MEHLTRQQVRRVDEVAINDIGIPGLVLMENAGRGVADVMCSFGIEGKVVIACSKGNNGGDGFVLARHLGLRGFDVEVLLCCAESELTGDALKTFAWLAPCGVPVTQWSASTSEVFASADWLVDALLGTGASGAPRSPLNEVIHAMNACKATRLAVDLPSGMDCDTGELADPTFQAEHTCTFVAPKPCLMLETTESCVGEIHVLDIGLPWEFVEETLGLEPVDDAAGEDDDGLPDQLGSI